MRNIRYTGCIILSILCLLQACKKADSRGESSFKEQPLPFSNATTEPVKLNDGTFISIVQNLNYDTVVIIRWDAHIKELSRKTLPFARFVNSSFALDDKFFVASSNINVGETYLTMFDLNGNVLWDRTIGFPAFSVAACRSADGNVDVVASAVTYDSVTADNYFMKCSATSGADIIPLTAILDTPYYKPYVTYIAARQDGLYMSGYYYYTIPGGYINYGNSFLMKTNEDSIISWFIKGEYYNKATVGYTAGYGIGLSTTGDIAQVSIVSPLGVDAVISGGFYLFNYLYVNEGVGNIRVAVNDAQTGKMVNERVFTGLGNVAQPYIAATPDRGYIVVATGGNLLQSTNQNNSIIVVKMDTHLNIQWQKTYNMNNGLHIVSGLAVLNDGYRITGFSGTYKSNSAQNGIFFLTTDLGGNLADVNN